VQKHALAANQQPGPFHAVLNPNEQPAGLLPTNHRPPRPLQAAKDPPPLLLLNDKHPDVQKPGRQYSLQYSLPLQFNVLQQ